MILKFVFICTWPFTKCIDCYVGTHKKTTPTPNCKESYKKQSSLMHNYSRTVLVCRSGSEKENKTKMSENDDYNEKNGKLTNTCNENVEQYLLDSTLHGLRYVGNRKISYFERYNIHRFLSFLHTQKKNNFPFKYFLWIVVYFGDVSVGVFHFKHL